MSYNTESTVEVKEEFIPHIDELSDRLESGVRVENIEISSNELYVNANDDVSDIISCWAEEFGIIGKWKFVDLEEMETEHISLPIT